MRDARVTDEVRAHPYPLLFATVSGAHLYGFPSPDSDYDLRGVHLLPLDSLVGLGPGDETVALSHVRDGAEVDLVTHDARKFFALLLRNNGYVLEQLYSPLVVHTTPGHDELREIARGCITRRCVRHYVGFAAGQWRLFETEQPRRVKPLLYVYRVLLTGIHLMRTGRVQASLPACNAEMRLPYVDELIARKTAGPEHSELADADVEFHRGEYLRLHALLVNAAERSPLPDEPTAHAALHDLLLRIRLAPAAVAA
ncbi:nucleotidyltransferase domain-containing protein [Longimicrobium sp.]|uniref:nucleotidyltransferase domain-containing protein n=1 Tax=Longimicrobium sp. TaxID=2029185 RepID=UPI002E322E5B|nr:nucleotidyltransferase domain-containing protein [Longimicrobium sp.]HEX6036515.1 nucleotidyltransferase domain-containing protein [Longimicrobium sp.]